MVYLSGLIPDVACSRGFARVKGVTCEGEVFASYSRCHFFSFKNEIKGIYYVVGFVRHNHIDPR